MPIPAFTGGHEPHEHRLITRIWYQQDMAGYDIDDTPQGPRLRARRARLEQ